MRPTVLFFCIASLTLAFALPTWKQVATYPKTLSRSLRSGVSTALGSALICRDYYEYYSELCSMFTPEEEQDYENSFTDLGLSNAENGYNVR